MFKRREILVFVTAAITGLMGGLISTQLFTSVPAFARPSDYIRAEEIEIVGEDGVVRARLAGARTTHTYLDLHDENGNLRMRFVVSPDDRQTGIWLYDKRGDLALQLSGDRSSKRPLPVVRGLKSREKTRSEGYPDKRGGRGEQAAVTQDDLSAMYNQLINLTARVNQLTRYH